MELRLFIEPQQGASYADQLAIARKAEEYMPALLPYLRSDVIQEGLRRASAQAATGT
jgi:hypothetical protein